MKILVVEDEIIIAMSTILVLKNFGFETIGPVFYAEDAVKKYIEEKPDIILMDIFLKGEKNGIDAAHNIRNLENGNVLIIFVTASTDPLTIKSAKEVDNTRLLHKPYEKKELKDIFDSLP